MLQKFAVAFFSLFIAMSSEAQIIYQQMQKDFQSLENEIQKMDLSDEGVDALGFQVTRSGARVMAFRLQGVLRLLVRSRDFSKKQSETLQELFSDVKAIEDVIGKMDEASSVLKTAKNRLEKAIEENNSDKKIEELRKKVKSLSVKAAEQSKTVGKIFKQAGWLKVGAAADRTEDLGFLQDWKGAEEFAMITTVIRSQYSAFKTKISEELLPNFKKAEFGHDSMEHNFHEFRRIIRWASIYLQSIPGIFSLTPYTLDGLSAEQIQIMENYRKYKYAQIESENSPIVVDRYPFYLLAHFVKQAGDSKDEAESHFKALENGLESSLDEDQFKKDMIAIMEGFLAAGVLDSLSKNISDY